MGRVGYGNKIQFSNAPGRPAGTGSFSCLESQQIVSAALPSPVSELARSAIY